MCKYVYIYIYICICLYIYIYIYIFQFHINYKEKPTQIDTHTPHTIDSVAHFVALASNCFGQIEFLKLLLDFEPTPKLSKNKHFQKRPQNTKNQTVRRQGLDFETDFDAF